MATVGLTHNDVKALEEVQVINEIFEGTVRESKALSLFKRLPNMSSKQTKLRVLDSLPIAYFVNEETKNGRKSTTKMAWENKFITAAEIAVIVPIKENDLADSDVDLWAQIRPRISEAFARKIDNAMLMGVGKPADWRKGLVPSIIDAGKEVTETGNLYKDIDAVMAEVEESGYDVNGLVGGVGLKSKFRLMTDTTGQPLNTTEIGSLSRTFVNNGTWDKAKSVLVAGDFNQAVYSIRQDLTFKLLTEGVIQDPETDEIMYNLAQEDMVALRCVMRLGWEIPNPVNAEDESSTRFPFASLKPASRSGENTVL